MATTLEFPAIATVELPALLAEPDRARVLAAFGLDTLEDDPELAAIARFAARLCETPVALVNVIEPEQQRFLAHEGVALNGTETVATSFCVHTMQLPEGMEVADARADPRFAANAFVTGEPFVRFYAGEPLTAEEGTPLGALCVLDTVPRTGGLTDFQREGLQVLAQATMRRLRSRRHSLAARRESEDRDAYMRSLADSIPAIAWATDADGNFEYFNKRMVDFTGLEDTARAFHPDDWRTASVAWRHSLETGEAYEFEHRLRRHDGEYRWMISRALPFRDSSGRIMRWFGTAVDIHDIHAASEARDLLARELSHRIKNIFAVVAGLISLSIRRQPEHREFGERLVETIRALGRAHDYVGPAGQSRSSTLHGMLGDLFSPYRTGERVRVRIAGDDAAVAARAATPLALVFHELATNSAKYGALSTADGQVELTIENRGETLRLRWVESGGPPVSQPSAQGFGSRLVDVSVKGQLGGSWERHFAPDGLVCELVISKAAISS